MRPALIATALLSGGLIAGALFLEHVLGVLPCKLCLVQRYPHYAIFGLSLAGLAAGAARLPSRRLADMRAALLFAAGIAFLYTGGYGVFHTGVERGWWPGPADCSGSALPESTAALDTLLAQGEEFVRCDAPPWTVLGLSLANYNTLISLPAAVFVLFVAAAWLKTRIYVPREQHG
ncbi:MAG: disulfide bond formation protein B [Alphaproteobacteria bacterium]